MPHAVTIKSLPAALAMMKAMQAEGLGWGEDWRPLARQAVAEIIADRMHEAIDAHLLRVADRGEADRRNGTYRRRILTELGDIELSVPRTRTWRH
jgi:transposase-like protein